MKSHENLEPEIVLNISEHVVAFVLIISLKKLHWKASAGENVVINLPNIKSSVRRNNSF